MSLLNWEKSYSVGVEKFNDQHEKLFSMINEFYDLMQENKDVENLKRILGELSDYGKKHLKDEEEVFDKYDYPEKEGHKKIHDLYRAKIDEFLSKEVDMFLPFDVIDYLEDWWLDHINKVDKRYAKFLNEQGVK